MRNLINRIAAFVIFASIAMSCNNNPTITQHNDTTVGNPTNHENYPTEIVQFVNAHFPNETIIKYEEDKFGAMTEYEVKLSSGTELEFGSDKQIKDIDAPNGIPASAIPSKMKFYVDTNYPNTKITEWEMDKNDQSIELSNGIELEFDLNNNFVRQDR